MKKMILMLMLLCLPLSALADVPDGIWAQELTPEELLPLMQSAMAEELPGAVICTDDAGAPLAVYEFGNGFCAAQRADGLMMLCCFYAQGDALRLEWHNDLLLSYGQELSLSADGPTLHTTALPAMTLCEDELDLLLPQWDGSRLQLHAEYLPEGWRVTEMGVYARNGDRWRAVLALPEDCLSRDIFLSACHPEDWNAIP